MIEDFRQKQFTLGDILSGSWRIFLDRFETIILIALTVYIPINIILYLFSPEKLMGSNVLAGFKIYLRIIQFLEGIIGILATIAVAFIVENYINGGEMKYKEAFKKSFKKWGRVIITNFIAGIIVGLLYLLIIIPGIIWQVYYTFAVYVVIFKDKSGYEALTYSKSLVQGNWWKVFGISIALFLLNLIWGLLISVIFWLLPDGSILNIIPNTLIDIGSMFFIVAATIFFLNLDYLRTNEISENLGKSSK